ncbi:deoxyribose-phosphate aldolase [Paenibacillus sp. GCM10023252]|uniref:deoxyribose-phosphate aldolase n=1 Tax=Paenibacillus sp. GCM10023252 TaxID=3252649 RepID=UPI00360EFACC
MDNNKVQVTGEQVAGMIDHTLLKADATKQEVEKLCEEAREYKFATVCVNPTWVALCAKLLEGSGVGVTTVVGFPLGATTTAAKAAEAQDAIANGATEVDMVLNIGLVKSGDLAGARADIAGVAAVCQGKAVLKVILETGLLTDEEKAAASKASVEAGADFVKTSTGFGKGGATVEDIALMRRTVGPDLGVKASGGVRDYETAAAMIQAGATRIGASSGIAIVTGGKGEGY